MNMMAYTDMILLRPSKQKSGGIYTPSTEKDKPHETASVSTSWQESNSCTICAHDWTHAQTKRMAFTRFTEET